MQHAYLKLALYGPHEKNGEVELRIEAGVYFAKALAEVKVVLREKMIKKVHME